MKDLRPLGVMAAALLSSALLGAACTSYPVVDPSVGPSGPPASAFVSNVAPSLTVTPGTSPAPGVSSTASASPPASPSASPSASLQPPLGEALFSDDFSDAGRPRWGTGRQASGSVGYADGTLRIGLAVDLNSLWSWRTLETDQAVEAIRTEGTVATSGTGAAGWLCGAQEDRFVGGLIHSSGDWVIVDITGSLSRALDRGPLPEGIDPALPHRLTVECSGGEPGQTRIRLSIDGQETASLESLSGIEAFDRVGAYAFADLAGYAAAFDDVAVYGEEAETAGSPGPDGPSSPSP